MIQGRSSPGGRAQDINIVFKDNGQGLSRDARLLEGILTSAGHSVSLSPQPFQPPLELRFLPEQGKRAIAGTRNAAIRWTRSRGRRWDLNIFLEGLDERYLGLARTNFFFPNQEWLTREDRGRMGALDLVLFKTRHAEERLADAARKSALVGFTSEDKRRTGVTKDWNTALHVAGWNPYKGTEAILAAWRSHPEWPTATVVAQSAQGPSAANLQVVTKRLSHAALAELQNGAGLHLCPSEAEGFGHSINEARSCGAAVLTTDGPPMNELVTPASGLLAPYGETEPMASGTRYKITGAGLNAAVERWIQMSLTDRERLGAAARAAFEADDEAFRANLLRLVASC
ncbi:MAG: glycosyltransferase [Vicinamibacterales bacterium]